MRFVQFHVPDQGKRLGLIDGPTVTDITCGQCATVLDVVRLAAEGDCEMDEVVGECSRGAEFNYEELDIAPTGDKPHLLLPIDAPEVWGCGVTYLRSASMRDVDSEQDIYSKVYNSDRPEVFFKATPSRCVGPNGDFGMRQDSDLTATEPELAIVLGRPDQILGYSVCNDVSAWDIERENPLYLPQSKTFEGCCALGPCVATNSAVSDPTQLEIDCTISRGGESIYEGEANSSQIKFSLEQLVEFLTRNNPIPVGTVLSTGTGIMVPNEFAHQPGDLVEITIENIGTLRNGARHLS
ncbi:MAG: fumarylacetoacetate hydrolase family protein [Planctomycetota bacterium]|jgi:2-dehydro-3-deoxy-D-arabinonate dehydratase|nr:fumarylacetoacetate hydrolase family protein [Planctomycetota bacterium]